MPINSLEDLVYALLTEIGLFIDEEGVVVDQDTYKNIMYNGKVVRASINPKIPAIPSDIYAIFDPVWDNKFMSVMLGYYLRKEELLGNFQSSVMLEEIENIPFYNKDIDIKIVGARKGERLIEPLWLEEENPTPTKYKKLLQLDNKEYTNERLEVLLKALHPICFYTHGHEAEFRDKNRLVQLLCDDCESLRNFYEEIKNDNQKRTDLL